MKHDASNKTVAVHPVRSSGASTRRRKSPPRSEQLEHFEGGDPDWAREYVIRERKLIGRAVVTAAILLPLLVLVIGIIAGLSGLTLTLVVAVALGPQLVLVRRMADLLF